MDTLLNYFKLLKKEDCDIATAEAIKQGVANDRVNSLHAAINSISWSASGRTGYYNDLYDQVTLGTYQFVNNIEDDGSYEE